MSYRNLIFTSLAALAFAGLGSIAAAAQPAPPGEETPPDDRLPDGVGDSAEPPVELDSVEVEPGDQPGQETPGYVSDPVKPSGVLPIAAVEGGRATIINPGRDPNSIGGLAVNDREVRWQAQLYQPWARGSFFKKKPDDGTPLWQLQHLCGGVLIAPNWVLSAAHCLDNNDSRVGYRVRLGAEDIARGGGWTYRIDRVIRHPSYRDQPNGRAATRYDIALIHYISDVAGQALPPTSQVIPIPIHRTAAPADRSPVFATGWGKVSNTESRAIMMKVQLNLVDTPRCEQLWGEAAINEAVLCAGAEGSQTCQGDSGGPLVNRNGAPTVLGIVSWNNQNCFGDVNKPGVYTRVAAYAEWIDSVIGR